MTFEIGFVLIVILLAFILFVTEKFPIDVTALFILGVLLISRRLTPEESISGFSNPAVITIAALFILSHALQKTGLLEYLVVRINKISSKSINLGLILFLLSVSIASAFINNTAIVAIFIPITIRMAQKYKMSPSKLLIPLSYAAILGGTLTLVGTSTNLIVNATLVAEGSYQSLGMLEFAKYGIIQLMIGLTYIMLVGRKLLPSRTVTTSLTRNYHLGGFLTEFKVRVDSPLVGKTCLERGLNRNYDIIVLDILRDEKLITTNIRNTIIEADDILFVRGTVDNFLRMKEVEKVTLLTDEKLTDKELIQEDNILIECLLTNKSDLVGKSLMEINFRRRFGSFVLAMRREGAILRRKVAHIVLKAFDTLLVYGSREKINEMSLSGDFIVMEEFDYDLKKHRLWWLGFVVLVAVVILSALSIVPILSGAILGVITLLIFRVLSPNEAYSAIHWQVIVLIAALIPLGLVIQSSGTADWIGNILYGLVNYFPDGYKYHLILSLIYLLTVILTEVSSNVATAIIMSPIAISVALKMGLDPRPFIFAVCFAASASFITPIGYQTNLMVYGPGGYKFTDFMKIGLPLAFILWMLASFLIPIIWPFTPV